LALIIDYTGSRLTNACPQKEFGIWPAATNVLGLHPHQSKVAKRMLLQNKPCGNLNAPDEKSLKAHNFR